MPANEFDAFCRFAFAYLERTLLPICERAADMAPWSRLRRLLAPPPPAG
jgi:hypothetical protein